MKSYIKILAGVITVGFSMTIFAGVSNTVHNLGSTGPGTNNTTGTTEVCVFCHTPHGANTGVAAPLWNKSVPDTAGYDSYSSSTIDGGQATVGSVSLACLSCHDGSQAMDIVVNIPGSGGYDLAGANNGTNVIGGTWSGSDTLSGIAAIGDGGLDLRNDHPVSIQYAGGGATDTVLDPATQAFGDSDFNALDTDTINGTRVWWVDTAPGTADSRDKFDMILYSYDGPNTGNTNEPMVECASCHDPHKDDSTTFLRIPNTNSNVCLACHIK